MRTSPIPFLQTVHENPYFQSIYGERLASWDGADSEASGIPIKEIIELYKMSVPYHAQPILETLWASRSLISDNVLRWGEHETGFGMILTGNIQIRLTVPHLQCYLIIGESHPFHGSRVEAWKQVVAARKAKGGAKPGRRLLSA